MATRNARTPPPARAAAPDATARPWDWAGEFGRQQMAVASEGACALFRGFESLRRIQEQAAHAAAERHAVAAQKIRQPSSSPTDLALLQAEVLGEDLACAARYWQDLAGAVLEMNTEIFNCATHLVDTEDVMAATSARFLHS